MTDARDQEAAIDVVWCSPHPNHYNTFLFERLAGVPGLRLRLVYFDEKLAIYPWKSALATPVPVSYLRRRGGIDWGFLRARLRSPSELVVVSGWNEPTALLLLLCFSAIGRPFILWSDTPNPKRRTGPRQWLRSAVLAAPLRRVFRYLVTGGPGVEGARRLGVAADRIVNFPFATDTERFAPAESPPDPDGTITCLSSGRLDIAHKAYDVGVEAFALVKSRHPEVRFRWVIAGEGPDRAAIERLVRERGLTAEVEFRGWLEPGDLPRFYHSGDVFVHPSNFDPFPNAVLEAMASGLPVVGSLAAGSVRDRVVDAENGFTHDRGDATGLAEKLARILSMPAAARRRMGENARGTAERWHVDYHCATFASVLDAVRDRRRSRGGGCR